MLKTLKVKNKTIFKFIENHSKAHSIKRLCSVLGVSKSGFYKQLQQEETKTHRDKLMILGYINNIRKDVRST